MNQKQWNQASEEALRLINEGYDPYDLVIVKYLPCDHYSYEDEIEGLSTPMSAVKFFNAYGFKTDHTCYTLGVLCSYHSKQ